MRRIFAIVKTLEEWIIAIAMLALALLAIANVFSRNIFNHSLAFAEELSQFLIILICFVGLSYAAARGRHIRMTALYDQLPPKLRKATMILIAATTSALMFFLAWLAIRYAWSVDSFSPVLRVPLYIVYMTAPLGLLLAGVQYAMAVLRNLTTREIWISFDTKDAYEEPVADGI